VAASTVAIDLNSKLRAYERNGVQEYLVVLPDAEPAEVRWMRLQNGRFETMQPDTDGFLKSSVFPGLWLDPEALLAGDLPKLAAAVEAGCATPEHEAFVERLHACEG
jgi:Uma2 family endonuclease